MMVCCSKIISRFEMCGIVGCSVFVSLCNHVFNSLFVEGNPICLHHLRMALSVTPYILPISVKGFSLMSRNNASLEGLSAGETLCTRLCFKAHSGHQVDLEAISYPQFLQQL